jgi:hypothetical protein
MDHLPPDFERDLVQVLEPGDVRAAAEIINAATALDDDGLRVFLDLFAERVRLSSKPVRRAELQDFLRRSRQPGRADAP